MNFDKESKSEKTKIVGLKVCGCGLEVGVGWRGGGGGNAETKTVNQTVKRGKIQNSNHLHNVGHVILSTFQNMRITVKVQTLQL